MHFLMEIFLEYFRHFPLLCGPSAQTQGGEQGSACLPLPESDDAFRCFSYSWHTHGASGDDWYLSVLTWREIAKNTDPTVGPDPRP